MAARTFLTARDRQRLDGVHPDLVRVVLHAAQTPGCPRFCVIEGVRTRARQAELVKQGASATLNSRHIRAPNGYGHAVDLAPLDASGNVSWAWPHYYPLAAAIKAAAAECGVPIEWGGDWRKFKDGPHWQLPWTDYAGANPAVAAGAPMTAETETQALASSRTIGGAALAGAGAGGSSAFDELATIIEPLAAYSNYARIAFAVLTAIGLATVVYARWDDAGRPLPWRRG